MSSLGPQYPSTAVSQFLSPNGFAVWVNPGNVTSSNNVYAVATLNAYNLSNQLKVTAFDFSAIPSGSTIDGVTIFVECKASTSFYAVSTCRVVVGDVVTGTPKGVYINSATDATLTYGGPTDLHGLVLTRDQVAASNFGFVFYCENTDSEGMVIVSVDSVSMTVNYTSPLGVKSSIMLMGCG